MNGEKFLELRRLKKWAVPVVLYMHESASGRPVGVLSDVQDKLSSISLHLTNSFKQCNHGLKYVAGSSDDTIDLYPNQWMLNLLRAEILLFTVL